MHRNDASSAENVGMTLLADPADPRFDDYRDLRDPARRAERDAARGCFIAEGVTVVRRLLESSVTIRSVLVHSGKAERVADLVPPGVPLYEASPEVVDAVVGFEK